MFSMHRTLNGIQLSRLLSAVLRFFFLGLRVKGLGLRVKGLGIHGHP